MRNSLLRYMCHEANYLAACVLYCLLTKPHAARPHAFRAKWPKDGTSRGVINFFHLRNLANGGLASFPVPPRTRRAICKTGMAWSETSREVDGRYNQHHVKYLLWTFASGIAAFWRRVCHFPNNWTCAVAQPSYSSSSPVHVTVYIRGLSHARRGSNVRMRVTAFLQYK